MDSTVALDGEQAQHAVEVAPRIWWVGDVLTGDLFQCHAYLIEAGPRSVLVDPGSSLTIDATLRKVQEVVALDDIRTIVLHHSDPDVADSLHVLGDVLARDVHVVTEWRSALLLRHMAARFPFTTIEDLGWRLELEPDRVLEFLLTPYLHFPGAFVTFDTSTHSLLSSDLFGGFNRANRLWAATAEDFEDLRQFHEHYMPSREILMAGLATITTRFPRIDRVLPQHGYAIPGELVAAMFEQLSNLECGVLLASRSDTHLAQLLAMAAGVRRIEQILESPLPLGDALAGIGAELGAMLPLREFWAEVGAPPSIVRFSEDHPDGTEQAANTQPGDELLVLHLPDGHDEPHIVVVLRTDGPAELVPELSALLSMVATRVHHVADEALDHRAQFARERLLQQVAATDPLTGLGNRRALDAARPPSERAAVLMIDIDHFKLVNDTYGHAAGDQVLRAIAAAVTDSIRRSDTAIRYGGEELLAVVELDPDTPPLAAAASIADRIRHAIAALGPDVLGIPRVVTVSVGAAVIDTDTPRDELIRRADLALYRAKEAGRNRTVVFDDLVATDATP